MISSCKFCDYVGTYSALDVGCKKLRGIHHIFSTWQGSLALSPSIFFSPLGFGWQQPRPEPQVPQHKVINSEGKNTSPSTLNHASHSAEKRVHPQPTHFPLTSNEATTAV